MKQGKSLVSLILLWMIVVFSIFPIIPMSVQAASSQTSWDGYFPSTSAYLDQTIETSNNDSHAEVSLAANMGEFIKHTDGTYTFYVGVVAVANTRHNTGYSVSYSTSGIPSMHYVHTLTLSPNSGANISLDEVQSGLCFNYYGATYHSVFITSNGFLVVDTKNAYSDDGGKWTSPTPRAIPSADAPPGLIAPLWRHLDISRGGQIRYGQSPLDQFMVVWENVPNHQYPYTPQTFAVVISPPDRFVPSSDSLITFIYGSITNDVATSIGIQDQLSSRGLSIAAQSNGKRVDFTQNYPGNYEQTDYLKISCSKTKADGSNNDKGTIHVIGVHGMSDWDYPGGINVEQLTSGQYDYTTAHSAWSAAKYAMSLLAKAGKTVGKFLGIAGFVISTFELLQELFPAPRTEVKEAELHDMTAYTKNLGTPPVDGWDTAVFATFIFDTSDPSFFQQLEFNVELAYSPMPTRVPSTIITLDQPLRARMTPSSTGDYDWLGRTNPDGQYYNFYRPRGFYGYHIDAQGISDQAYDMMGWNKLNPLADDDHQVRPDGTIRVDGDFRMYDNLPPSLQTSGRKVNLYVMYSSDLNTIAGTKQLLGPSDATGTWIHTSKTTDMGALTPNAKIKIGIGRPVLSGLDYSYVAEWSSITVYDMDYVLTILGNTHGTTNPSPRDIAIGIVQPPNPPTPYSIQAVPDTGYELDHWIVDGQTRPKDGNWYTVMMGHDHTIQPVFVVQRKTLAIGSATGGTTNPSAGTHTYDFGTIVTVNAYSATYYSFHHWTLDGITYTSNPIFVSMQTDHTLIPYFSYGGGGGGDGGCPYVYTWNGLCFVKDNNLLPASEVHNGTETKDYYKLERLPASVPVTTQASLYWLQIREFENEIDYIDQVRLLAVDHSTETNVAVTPEGEVLTYVTPTNPILCVDNHGMSRLDEVGSLNGNVVDPTTFFQGYKDDWLILNFGECSGPYAKLILRDDQKCTNELCIDLQVPDGKGGWLTIEVLHPRDLWSIEAVNMTAYLPKTGDLKVRLYWTAPHRLDYVGLDTSQPTQTKLTTAQPAIALHSELGNVNARLLFDDEKCVRLVNGQQITMAFLLPNNMLGTTRDFILYANGYYYNITS